MATDLTQTIQAHRFEQRTEIPMQPFVLMRFAKAARGPKAIPDIWAPGLYKGEKVLLCAMAEFFITVEDAQAQLAQLDAQDLPFWNAPSTVFRDYIEDILKATGTTPQVDTAADYTANPAPAA